MLLCGIIRDRRDEDESSAITKLKMQSPFISVNLIQKQMAALLQLSSKLGTLGSTFAEHGPTKEMMSLHGEKNEVKIETENTKRKRSSDSIDTNLHG